MTEITLTFDNGPSVATTPGVLDELQARDLSAYFCLIGTQLLKGTEQVDIAKETLARGHTIVNHSYTHGVALGDAPTAEHARHEIADTHALMNDKLGNWGRQWFRPFGRGGERGEHLLSQPAVNELHAHSYSVLIWNCVPRDWEDPTGWVETALTEIAALDHTVLVVHDLNTGAMDHLGRFLDAVLERGDTITHELPDSCVPMRSGLPVWESSKFESIVTAGTKA